MNKDDRITLMQSMRQEGKSLQEIGNNLGISRQAVFQAIGKTGRKKVRKQYIKKKKPFWERFWDRVKKKDNGCWEWTSSKINSGYGVMHRNGKTFYAHRLAYESYFGEIPNGLDICHKCDNPACCNPDHLFSGTALDNVHDSMQKGRFLKGRRDITIAGYMTIPNAAEIAHCTTAGINMEIRRGHLSAIKIGRYWRISPDDFYKWLKESRHIGGRRPKTISE